MSVVGADVGGTKIAAAQVVCDRSPDSPPQVGSCVVLPTLSAEPLATSIHQLFAALDRCLTDDVSAIGICAPGPLNPVTGTILNPPNLPFWRGVPLAKIVAERYSRPCYVENDANAAGLAETLFGAARGFASVLYVTISTGIGTGIILNGRIYHGKNGAAGEGGHVSIAYDSPYICNCGVPGCIEALASGTALAARGYDPASLDEPALDQLALMLSAWLGSVISLLDPEIIVVGGGISQIGEPLFSRLRTVVPSRTINQFAAATPIIPAAFAENVGIIGAAAVALSLVP